MDAKRVANAGVVHVVNIAAGTANGVSSNQENAQGTLGLTQGCVVFLCTFAEKDQDLRNDQAVLRKQ